MMLIFFNSGFEQPIFRPLKYLFRFVKKVDLKDLLHDLCVYACVLQSPQLYHSYVGRAQKALQTYSPMDSRIQLARLSTAQVVH